jgi:hypothetical protein
MNENKSIRRGLPAPFAVWPITDQNAENDRRWDRIAGHRVFMGYRTYLRLVDWFCCLSLWASLPMTIWLNSGWIGLLIHWQALSRVACLLQSAMISLQPAFSTVASGTEISQGDVS